MEIKDLNEQLNKTIEQLKKGINFDDFNKVLEKNKPKGSRRIEMGGFKAIATITQCNNIVIEFDIPEEGLKFYNSLKLSE